MVRPATRILDRNGELLYEVIDPNAGKQIDLSLAAIPQACVDATLATEDRRFFYHPGVDPIAIVRALWQNVAGGSVFSGGSTLTQQLARSLLLPIEERLEQSLERKLREAWLAFELERLYSKDELLALYLNQTYYGNFAYGIEAAAQVFFAKPAEQLSQAECALLAGLVQYPSGYNPLLDPETAKGRQLTVLRLLRDGGFLSAGEMEQIAGEPLVYRSHLFDISAPHLVMTVQEALVARFGADRLREGGLTVTTTADLFLQRQAEATVQRRLRQLTCQEPGFCKGPVLTGRRIENAAAVVLDSAGGDVLAMVGSPDYFDPRISGNVNAALSLRQPGSAIKPLTYAAALDPQWSARAGVPPLTAASILPDLPVTFQVPEPDGSFSVYRPLNYDRAFHGPVSVRSALANSYNIPAVTVLDRIGVDTLRQLAGQAGIRTFTGRYGLALTLGGGDVRLLELAAAYGTLDDGRSLTPRLLLRVEDAATGELLFDAGDPPAGQQVIAPETAWLITDILADDSARAPAFGSHSILELPFAAAVKTGTTTDWRDNWTVGYSTERVIGVWVGNADNTPMLDVSGVDGAGPIWHDLMILAHDANPPDFVQPPAITDALICAPSGLLPTPACPRTRIEHFLAGSEPTVTDNQFRSVVVERSTGLAAGSATPPIDREERVFWYLPVPYHDWMQAQGIPLPPDTGPADATAANQFMAASPEMMQAPGTTGPLVLRSPTHRSRYQLHPGAPGAVQQIALSGYANDGGRWAALRFMVDGLAVISADNARQLEGWWPLQLGEHQVWLEGERTAGAGIERSEVATITVDPFSPPLEGQVLQER